MILEMSIFILSFCFLICFSYKDNSYDSWKIKKWGKIKYYAVKNDFTLSCEWYIALGCVYNWNEDNISFLESPGDPGVTSILINWREEGLTFVDFIGKLQFLYFLGYVLHLSLFTVNNSYAIAQVPSLYNFSLVFSGLVIHTITSPGLLL